MFQKFSQLISAVLGSSLAFLLANLIIIFWILAGPYFNYSDSWEILINTVTTIITFLMVFLIQYTQNRHTTAIHLKLDEIIRATHDAHNELLKVEELSDEELQILLKRYEALASDVKEKIKKGESDLGVIS